MKSIVKRPVFDRPVMITLGCLVMFFVGMILTASVYATPEQQPTPAAGERLVTVHDNGKDRGILTKAATLRQAFKSAGIHIDPNDLVEPGLDETLVARNYEVNIYRARPVTIVDGSVRVKVMSPYQTPQQIAQHAGILMHDEDEAEMTMAGDMVSEGAGVKLAIDRATEFTFIIYGKKTTAYTQESTVADMLKKKNVVLGANDALSVDTSTPIKAGMTVELWRNGAQTVTEEQPISFATEKILAMDLPIGNRQVKTQGQAGVRMVTYEIVMQNGKELSRKEIQNVINKEPVKQVELVGNKSVNGLTKSKGAGVFTDSQGVAHRETYYDLPMSIVMRTCAGGDYTIRSDGAKIDRDGYILVAAHLGRYPRCSVVETSMGLGKVYDTGGFVAKHPDGFDLATDWTNYDGR